MYNLSWLKKFKLSCLDVKLGVTGPVEVTIDVTLFVIKSREVSLDLEFHMLKHICDFLKLN